MSAALIPTFVINLDQDKERLEALTETLKKCSTLSVARVPAIYGADLPQAVCATLTHTLAPLQNRGTLGCFLSHVRAWECVQAETRACLVLEDDAVPVKLERLSGVVIPEDADLIFVNNRMAVGDLHSDAIPNCMPILEAVKVLNRTGKGVGGDGYLLKPTGAKKLLDAVSHDLFFGHVDWRMLRYSLKPSDFDGELAGTRCQNIVKKHHNPALPPQWGVIKAYCLSTALIRYPLKHTSTRETAL